jgi:hypothetical protein
VADERTGRDVCRGGGDLAVRNAQNDSVRSRAVGAAAERAFDFVSGASQGLRQREANAAAADDGQPSTGSCV